jgi:hypothetical protein
METPENRDEQVEQGDESPEEFAQEVENDPSTASSGDDELEQVRGG